MACCFPPSAPRKPASERVVFEALAELEDDWLVFHSVAWQAVRGGRQDDGEADFVLVHPDHGALTIEVKGGDAVFARNGQWYTHSHGGRNHRIPSPFDQAVDSKHALQRYLRGKVPTLAGRLRLGHAVCFPFVDVAGDLGPDAPRSIIWDRRDVRASIGDAVLRTVAHWGELTALTAEEVDAVRATLAPTFTVRRLLANRVEELDEDLLELTHQQSQLLAMLRRRRKALIVGNAGTGKTVLAVEKARQLAGEGARVLLTCYNRRLGAHLARQVADEPAIGAVHFALLSRQLAEQAGMLPGGRPTRHWWSHTLPAVLGDAASAVGFAVDAVIVDEGQDFLPHWWDRLRDLQPDPDEGFFYVFADAHQDLRHTGWVPPFDGEPYVLDQNCRNTVDIARRVNAVLGTGDDAIGVKGPPARFVAVDEPEELRGALARIVRELLDEGGLRPEQLAVLATHRHLVAELRELSLAGWDLDAEAGPGILVDTVHRFKGLEADAVVLVLSTEAHERDQRAVVYVGMSRARVLLYVVGHAAARAAINWT